MHSNAKPVPPANPRVKIYSGTVWRDRKIAELEPRKLDPFGFFLSGELDDCTPLPAFNRGEMHSNWLAGIRHLERDKSALFYYDFERDGHKLILSRSHVN